VDSTENSEEPILLPGAGRDEGGPILFTGLAMANRMANRLALPPMNPIFF
jgi:hypothetical protein